MHNPSDKNNKLEETDRDISSRPIEIEENTKSTHDVNKSNTLTEKQIYETGTTKYLQETVIQVRFNDKIITIKSEKHHINKTLNTTKEVETNNAMHNPSDKDNKLKETDRDISSRPNEVEENTKSTHDVNKSNTLTEKQIYEKGETKHLQKTIIQVRITDKIITIIVAKIILLTLIVIWIQIKN